MYEADNKIYTPVYAEQAKPFPQERLEPTHRISDTTVERLARGVTIGLGIFLTGDSLLISQSRLVHCGAAAISYLLVDDKAPIWRRINQSKVDD